jgi:esterase/lipase
MILYLQLLWTGILSFVWFLGVWILCADVSEHSVGSIFIGGVSIKNVMNLKLTTKENMKKNLLLSNVAKSFLKTHPDEDSLKTF